MPPTLSSLLLSLLALVSPLSAPAPLTTTELARLTPPSTITQTLQTILTKLPQRSPPSTNFTFTPNPPQLNQPTTLTWTDRQASPRQTYAWQFTPSGGSPFTLTTTGPTLTTTFSTAGSWTLALWDRFPNSTRFPLANHSFAVTSSQTLSADFQVLHLTHVDPITRAETWEPIGLDQNDPIPYGEKVKFQPTSPLAVHFRWRENNQLISTQPTVIKQYTGPQSLDIKLQVYNQDASQSQEATKRIWVGEGVRVLDVLPTALGDSRGLAIDGNIAWISRLTQQLVAVDVSSPENLTRATVFPARFGWNVAAANGKVFVATPSSGLDIHVNPLQANRQLYTYDTRALDNQQVYDVKARDNTAFLAAGPAGLKVLDVSNPSSVRLISQLILPANATAYRLALWQNYLLLADANGRVYLIDISSLDTTNPGPVGLSLGNSVQVNGVAEHLIVNDNGTLAVFGFGYVDLFEIVNNTEINFASRIDLVALGGRAAGGIGLNGNALYAAYANGGVWLLEIFTIDITDPRHTYVRQSIEGVSGTLVDVAGVIKNSVSHNGAMIWTSGSHDIFSSSL